MTAIFIWFISILLFIIYWCWLFFMCKMFLSFSIDVYVIFLYWNIWMNCTHFIFFGNLLMLTYFHMENVPEFQYCFWLFTDVQYCFLIIYWCWLFFMCKMFLSFLIDVYVIFLYRNILMNCMQFIFIGHLLMLIIFHVQNVLIILDLCLCEFIVLKYIHQWHTSSLVLYWCW